MSLVIHPLNDFDGKGWFRGGLRNPLVPVSLIVMHSTAGSSLAGAVSTLRAKGFGYHYLIEKSGKVWKCAPISRKLGHAGNSYGPREQAKGVSRKQSHGGNFDAGCSVNGYSIGISFVHENNGVTKITAAQMDSAISLVRELHAAMPKIAFVTTHAIVSPGRKSDPKPFDLDAFAASVGLHAWRYTG